MPTRFKLGDQVQCVSDPSRVGAIIEISEIFGDVQYYRVFFGAQGSMKMPELDLRIFNPGTKPCDNLIKGNIDSYDEFQRLITHQRLLRSHPLKNNIYAFNASRTRFFPYQFKPLFKFLDTPKNRLLIADEVGLGKTIEAGLLMTELRARQTVQRVLVVCPANLTTKWQMELKRRFGEEFSILTLKDILYFLDEYEESPNDTVLNGIVSYESIRSVKVLERLDAQTPQFDLVIADEAHWMRNFGTKQRQAGVSLSAGAGAMVFLTATPIHLGNENLFSLLNILDEDEFPDIDTADRRFQNNEPIVKAQICVGQIPPNTSMAIEILSDIDPITNIPQLPQFKEVMADLASLEKHHSKTTNDKGMVLKAQHSLSELNLIGHIFSRTRKREVQSNFPTRRAYPIRLQLTDLEKRFYDTVTQFVQAESEQRTASPVIQKWILNTPQRRMASSIPAMVDYYKDRFGLEASDISEDADLMLDNSDNGASGYIGLEEAREKLETVLKQWPKIGPDTKYDYFINILKELREAEGQLKVMVFAFFKDTLNYLKQRLDQDKFHSEIISGDVHPSDRNTIVENFRNKPDIEILLSSKVGTEGLDFQFCDTLFNYDLPWNPMEVEQRIGRLDRIGQESDVIRIYNFWIEGTIEERILSRLYDRIGIFERSIGEIELILGDELATLERDILSKKLDQDEIDALLKQKTMAVERRMEELSKLEANAAQFIGTDQFFQNEVKMISEKRRYITGEQLFRFITDFFKHHCPKSRLTYDHSKHYGKLYPDNTLRQFLIANQGSGEFIKYLSTSREGVTVTFDAQMAFENPKVDFINVLHPLTQTIANYYSANDGIKSNTHHVLLKTDRLPAGYFLYFIFKLRIGAARGGNTLEIVILDDELNEACSMSEAETILGLMVEKGENPLGAELDLDQEIAQEACHKAEEIFVNHVEEMRERTRLNNNAFVERRLESLRSSYKKNLDVKRNQLKNAKINKRDQRYIRMLEGTIRRFEAELHQKKNELEKHRSVQAEYDEISAGILEII